MVNEFIGPKNKKKLDTEIGCWMLDIGFKMCGLVGSLSFDLTLEHWQRLNCD
jgi:hypothetical protein